MLGISYSEVATDLSEEWYASYDYSPQILNSADDLFGYNRNLPSALVCTNSFRLSGFNYTITCFSDNQSDMLAQNELTACKAISILWMKSFPISRASKSRQQKL